MVGWYDEQQLEDQESDDDDDDDNDDSDESEEMYAHGFSFVSIVWCVSTRGQSDLATSHMESKVSFR